MASHNGGQDDSRNQEPPTGQPLQTVSEAIVTGIRRGILAGDIFPGQRLVEADLAKQFGGSRATARAALIALEGEGIVERTLNRGARVRVVTHQEAIELIEARMALEGLCAARAAHRITDEQSAELRRLGDEMQAMVQVDDDVSYAELNRLLHHRILEISGHEVAQELIGRVRGRMTVTHQFRIGLHPRRLTPSLHEHLEIISALDRRNSEEAEAAMRRHLCAVRDSLLPRTNSVVRQPATPSELPAVAASPPRSTWDV